MQDKRSRRLRRVHALSDPPGDAGMAGGTLNFATPTPRSHAIAPARRCEPTVGLFNP